MVKCVQANCLKVFDYYVGLALKGLNLGIFSPLWLCFVIVFNSCSLKQLLIFNLSNYDYPSIRHLSGRNNEKQNSIKYLQGSTNLIFAYTDFLARKMVLRARSCAQNYVYMKQ